MIIIMRLLHLCRSVDLAKSLRALSRQVDDTYILMKRKGQQLAQWKKLIAVPQEDLSRVHLLLKYVEMTSHLCLPGSLLLRALTPPHLPLTANSVGSIT